MAQTMTLDDAFEKLATHRFGQNQKVLDFLRETAVTSHADPALRKELNDGLVRILDSDAAYAAKQFACRQLALTATEEHIPVLARHLGDEKMTHMALYVLTHIDSPKVDKALVSALDTTTGNARLGIINMLGNRRCEGAVEPLGKLMISGDEQTSIAAIRALGRIGTDAAHWQFVHYDVVYDPPKKLSYAETMAFAHANLDLADRFLADGKIRLAQSRYMFAYDEQNPAHIRAAGLKGLAAAMGDKAGPFVAQALRSDDEQLYGMAATVIRTVPEKNTAEALIAELPKLEPNVQVLLINALADRNDGAGVGIVKDACKNHDIAVKQAALGALGKIGDGSCVPLLIEHAAVDSLTKLPGEKINAALVDRLRDVDTTQKAVICRALLARNAVEAAPAFLDAARNIDSSLRAEALKALHDLAGPCEIPALVDLIFIVEQAEADQVGRALAAVARRHSVQKECTQDILSKYDRAANIDQQVALLTTLGGLGQEQALPILREALQDGSNRIRYAAIKALSSWSGAAPAGELLELAKSSSANPTHRALALRGFIDLIDAAALPADKKLNNYRQAMQLAHQDAERKKVLSVLSSLNTLEAFQMAVAYLDDPSLKDEAALAACLIGQQIYTAKGRQIKDDLERIIQADVVESIKLQARQILQNINKVNFYVTYWEVSGPYVQEGKSYDQLFDIAFAPEIGSGKSAEWRKMPAGTDPAQPWYLDLLKALDGGEQRVAYLRTRLDWPAEQRVTLWIGSDDGVKLWINGKLVHVNNIARPFTLDQDTATANFKEGENVILMKITQNNMPWGASLRIEHEDL
jgi:HEAT repeat protein